MFVKLTPSPNFTYIFMQNRIIIFDAFHGKKMWQNRTIVLLKISTQMFVNLGGDSQNVLRYASS